MSRVLFSLLLVLALAGPGAAAPLVVEAGGGEMLIEPKHDLLGALGLRLAQGTKTRELRLRLATDSPLRMELGDGGPTALRTGRLPVPGLVLLRADGARTPELALVPAADRPLGFDIVDADGAVWLELGHAMRSPDAREGLRLVTAELRVGAALAEWTGTDGAGLLAARVELTVPLVLPGAGTAMAKSCAAPAWPTAGYVADVQLTDIDRISSLRCRVQGATGTACSGPDAFACDGPGGEEGEVVFVPNATLRNSDNADTADIPWYRMFTGNFAPYGNDQHPFLVWNLYRLDADGSLHQIARSGLKHAFATANTGCSDASCPSNGHILGRGCSDLYDAGSNDTPTALAPRTEAIPSTGQWGRCGSVFDQDCDGQLQWADRIPAGEDCYRWRMVALESALDSLVHPGARWFIEAWYVVRDDVDIFNTMGFREFNPVWLGDAIPQHWSPQQLGTFQQGSIVDLWLAQANLDERTARNVATSDEGQVLVAARVRREGNQWRYDYQIANYDLARAATSGTEPNLQILSLDGLGAVRVEAANGATGSAAAFGDGDADGGNDWTAASGGDITWTAPSSSAQMAWGQLMRFSLLSDHPPGNGTVQLVHAATGSPATVAAETLVPDGAMIFFDGLE